LFFELIAGNVACCAKLNELKRFDGSIFDRLSHSDTAKNCFMKYNYLFCSTGYKALKREDLQLAVFTLFNTFANNKLSHLLGR
jgi:hypothetical protein